MSFVKSQILDQLADLYPNFLRKDLEKALDIIFEQIIETLATEKNVQIRGFGSFKTKYLKSRIGRNPKNNSKISIPAKKSVSWKMSKELFKELNQNVSQHE